MGDATAGLHHGRYLELVGDMYPFLRMTLILRSEARKPPLGIFDTHARSMLCTPLDADMFWEMNNGRILTFYDLGRFGLAQRIGLIGTLRERGWGLVVAGSSVRYRARIRPFQRFELRTRLVGWDERFLYLEQAMWRGDTACNHALLRTGVTEKGRLVPTERVAEAMNVPATSPPLPDWVRGWMDADRARPWPPEV
jgi:acyl-CoA thioesterase FadM